MVASWVNAGAAAAEADCNAVRADDADAVARAAAAQLGHCPARASPDQDTERSSLDAVTVVRRDIT